MQTSLHALNIFVRAVESNSFVGAARSLLINPAAVSRAIKGLEAELGVLLFARSTRALRLTPEGARFYRDCVQILKKHETATQQFRIHRGTPKGCLRVGMGAGLTRRMLLRAIPAFRQQYPEIEIVLIGTDDVEDVDLLLRGRYLRQRGAMHSERQGLVVRRVAQSRLVVSASAQYLKSAGSPKSPGDLLRHTCIALLTAERDVQNEWSFVKSQMRRKIKFAPILVVDGTEALREAAVAGCGIIRSLVCHIEDELGSGSLIELLPDWECIGAPPMVAIYRKNRTMPPQVRLFVQHLTKEFRIYNIQ